jgi:AraC-type transcriptional regulator N-terminus
MKRTMLAERVFEYGAGQYLAVSVDLPIVSHVIRARKSKATRVDWAQHCHLADSTYSADTGVSPMRETPDCAAGAGYRLHCPLFC